MIKLLLALAVALQLSVGVAYAGDFDRWVKQSVVGENRSAALQFGTALQTVFSVGLDDREGLEEARGRVIDALSCLMATVDADTQMNLIDQIYAQIVNTPARELHMSFAESLFPEVDVEPSSSKCLPLFASR